MQKERINEFNVLEYDWTSRKVRPYNILPYFRDVWKVRKFNFEKEKVIDKPSLKEWIIRASQYTFWARCEYECLIGPWPFGSKKISDKIKQLLDSDFDITDHSQNIDFYNIITSDMQKIDIHEQILMNIDIITDILFDEFKIKSAK
jgi:hypothetical protein